LSRVEVAALYAAGQHAKVMERIPLPFRGLCDSTWDEQHAEEVLHFVDSIRHALTIEDGPHPAARAALLAECPRISPSTRFHAASVAIRAATYCSDPLAAVRAYAAGMALPDTSTHARRSKQELDLFFHTEFGDPRVALNAATSLAEQLDSYDDRSARNLMACSVAYGLRVNGDPRQAYNQCLRAYREASASHMVTTAAIVAWNASLIAFDAFDDADLAESWLERPECYSKDISHQRAAIILQQNRVRLAIVRSLGAVARTELDKLSEGSADPGLAFRAAYFLALKLGTARLNGATDTLAECLWRAVGILESTRAMVGQDFFVSQVVSAHMTLGRAIEAESILREYVHCSRRHRLALPTYLLKDCSLLNISVQPQ
jgi:hypothetical protein